MSEIKFDDTVDITDVVCPVTFVKAKVHWRNWMKVRSYPSA